MEWSNYRPPYPAVSIPDLLQKFKYPLVYPVDINKDCLDLLKGLLQINPNKRFSFDQFYNHKYVQECLAENPPLDLSLLESEEEKKYVMVDLNEIEGYYHIFLLLLINYRIWTFIT